MSQSLSQLYTHLIFSTKNRKPILQTEDRERLQEYIGGVLRNLKCPVVTIGVVKDHVHCLYRHSKNISVAHVVEEIKKGSSKWLKQRGIHYKKFSWQVGYGAFSVSASKVNVVIKYISNQHEHHKRVSFQEEYRTFLKRYHIEFKEDYVWD